MSAYNMLKTKVRCSNCANIYNGLIQFKFGDTWQFEYNIGDKIKWGGNDIGKPGITEVKVYGILDSDECPACKKENTSTEYDIIIKSDIIVKVNPISDAKEYFIKEESYKICTE